MHTTLSLCRYYSRMLPGLAVMFVLLGSAAGAEDNLQATRDVYQVVILRRGPKARSFTQDELRKMEAAHQAFLQRQVDSGKLVAIGPFADQADPTYRGMCLYRAGGVEEARKLAEGDPAVVAGRVRVEVMTWMTPRGWLAFPLLAGATSSAP
jgi:uncharacterized protein YciI